MTTTTTTITIEALINAPVEKVWELWTNPVDITNWSTPSPDWHTPRAMHDLKPGGEFVYRMEARDGSFGFDFGGRFDVVKPGHQLAYTMGDGRKANILFTQQDGKTKITETFDPENENPIEFQKAGWQAILDNFRKYAERVVLVEFQVRVNASKKHVWETMLHPATYNEWANAGWPGATYEGTWAEGEEVKFVSASGEGTLATLVAHKPYDLSHAKHMAVLLKGGAEDRDSELALGWIGTHERYTFTEEDGVTALTVTITTTPEWAAMFSDGWPKALNKLKVMCEQQ